MDGLLVSNHLHPRLFHGEERASESIWPAATGSGHIRRTGKSGPGSSYRANLRDLNNQLSFTVSGLAAKRLELTVSGTAIFIETIKCKFLVDWGQHDAKNTRGSGIGRNGS